MKTKLALIDKTPPTFAAPLHVGRPNIGNRDHFMQRVCEILDRRWLSNDGPVVQEFERALSDHLGVRHCIAMCNATVALEIAMRALELKGEVIVPSFTFVATVHALQWQEITPVFADIDPVTHTISPRSIERLITPRTTGIVGVHVWGRGCDTEAISAIASKHGLKVMYDAAHAFGCSAGGRMIGGFGTCEVFSFHATKFVNSFEGGAITTNDDDLARKLRLMRNFGFAGLDRVIYLGVNGKMTEICAAMGLTSLESVDQLIAINRRNYEIYRQELADVRGLHLLELGGLERHNYQYVVVEVDGRDAALNRDALVAVLHVENVLARRYFWPGCHRMEPYKSLQPNAGLLLPETERVASRVLILPTGELLGQDEIRGISTVIKTALSRAKEVSSALERTASG